MVCVIGTELRCASGVERELVMGVRLHRVHHARSHELRDKTFSGLVWWDKLFGTYKLIEDHRSVAVGVDDARFDTGRPMADCWMAMVIWFRTIDEMVLLAKQTQQGDAADEIAT